MRLAMERKAYCLLYCDDIFFVVVLCISSAFGCLFKLKQTCAVWVAEKVDKLPRVAA